MVTNQIERAKDLVKSLEGFLHGTELYIALSGDSLYERDKILPGNNEEAHLKILQDRYYRRRSAENKAKAINEIKELKALLDEVASLPEGVSHPGQEGQSHERQQGNTIK